MCSAAGASSILAEAWLPPHVPHLRGRAPQGDEGDSKKGMTHRTSADVSRAAGAGDPRPVFVKMFEAVRGYLLDEGRADEARATVATNPKGEATRRFDAMAERLALEVAERELGSFRALSEEAGELQCGAAPRWTLVLDPCDGSNNYRRGIRSVGFAVAALPVGAPLDPACVEYAVCGDIFTGVIYSAARGQGAMVDGRPCVASTTREPQHAMLGINLGRRRGEHRDVTRTQEPGPAPDDQGSIWRLLQTVSTVRRTGATVLDLCYVAQGAYDAYLDLRGRLTPENFLAPALVLSEARGCLTDPHGRPLGSVIFTEPYSILAAGSPELLAAILQLLA
jgi:myo-inositol-1(or 4)-monophosphatase